MNKKNQSLGAYYETPLKNEKNLDKEKIKKAPYVKKIGLIEKEIKNLNNEIKEINIVSREHYEKFQDKIENKLNSSLNTLTIFSFILVASMTILNTILINMMSRDEIKKINSSSTLINNSFLYVFVGFIVLILTLKWFDFKTFNKSRNSTLKWFSFLFNPASFFLLFLVAFYYFK